MPTDRHRLSHAGRTKREIAAYHRALGETQEQAAQAAGCSRQSISTWELSNDTDYVESYERCRRMIMREGGAEAWQTLRSALKSGAESIRVAAASKLVEALSRFDIQRHEISGPEGGPIKTYQIAYPEEPPETADE